jgi:alpha-1,2-mannosyltransferase
LKAEVAHISLNAGGGAERLSISAIKALVEMGIDVQLSTFERPNPRLINEAYGEMLDKSVSKIQTLGLMSSFFRTSRQPDGDIHINTHGDMLPLFHDGYSKNNSITYCHYPIAGFLIDSEDKDYLDLLFNMTLSHVPPEKRECLLEKAKDAYRQMTINSTVLTNSEFSRKAIFKVFGVDSTVLYPPVDTEHFRRVAISFDDRRTDDILVISRFHRSKKIENAIHLARLLKRRNVGRRMVIVGNLSPDGDEYYSLLQKLAKNYDLGNFVKFEPCVSSSRLIELMRRSKVYVHPLPGEPFGISTVEAMSAGMIPVVPDIGGHVEFVPQRYQFHTFGQGVDAVAAALDAPASEHLQMSNRAATFSDSNFVSGFKRIVTEVIQGTKPNTRQQVPAQKILKDSLA